MAKTRQMHFWTIIPAAGKGTRFHATCPENYSDAVFNPESTLAFSSSTQSATKQKKTKQYYLLTEQHNIAQYTIGQINLHPGIAGCIVATSPEDDVFQHLAFDSTKPVHSTIGGSVRAESVLRALDFAWQQKLIQPADWVLVHDIARPLISQKEISWLIQAISRHGSYYQGISLGLPIRDSIKRIAVQEEQHLMPVIHSESRQHIWRSITPQAARADILLQALKACREAPEITDEMSALTALQVPCALIAGKEQNIKITTWEDLLLARALLGNVPKQ